MLTAHESLTTPGVVLHLPRCCALARKAGVRLGWGPRHSRSPFQLPFRPLLQPKPASAEPDASHFADPASSRAICRRLKSHR